MIKRKDGYGGEVVLKNIAGTAKAEIMREIKNIGDRASRRDPEDQIIKIEDKGKSVRVTTTETSWRFQSAGRLPQAARAEASDKIIKRRQAGAGGLDS